jgi:hypothetical protein
LSISSWPTTLRYSYAFILTAQHSTAQHSTAQHSTAQHSTAQHSTAQHSTAQPDYYVFRLTLTLLQINKNLDKFNPFSSLPTGTNSSWASVSLQPSSARYYLRLRRPEGEDRLRQLIYARRRHRKESQPRGGRGRLAGRQGPVGGVNLAGLGLENSKQGILKGEVSLYHRPSV